MRFRATIGRLAGKPLAKNEEVFDTVLKEFKEFIGGGNVVDLAVGVIVGAALGKIIQSFVDELIVPLIGLLPGAGDLAAKYLVLKPGPDASKAIADGMTLVDARKTGAVVLGYGQFLATLITVVLTAFVVFLIVKQINKMKAAAPAPEPAGPTPDQALLTEIRDALKK